MSAVATETRCSCGSIGRTDLRQCPVDFHLWNGDRRLASVGSIVRGSFPLDPSIPADVLENARDRGDVADKLFAAYVLGKLDRIPGSTRRDSYLLFEKLRHWYDRQKFKTVEVQVLLGGEDHGGILDFSFDGYPVDLKCTSKIENSHRMQTALYALLSGVRCGALLHATERISEPRLVPLDAADFDDSEIMLAHWRMVKRRTS